MGMMRKTMSVSTAGLVSFRSSREKHAAAAMATARADRKVKRAEARLLDAERKKLEGK